MFNRRIQNLIADFRGLPRDRSRSVPRGPVSLGSALGVVIEKHQIGSPGVEALIMREWPKLIGPQNAPRCSPQRLMDNGSRLLVHTANSIIRQELMFQQQAILQRLRQIPGCEGIRQLVIRAG